MQKFVTATEAAHYLGVSRNRVQSLLKSGRLVSCGSIGRSVIIEPRSLHKVRSEHQGQGRAWSPKTSWSVLHLLSGNSIERADNRVAAQRLAHCDFETLPSKLRSRSTVKTYAGSMTAQRILREALPATGTHALMDTAVAQRFGASFIEHGADVYATHAQAAELSSCLNLVEDPAGAITLRVFEDSPFREGTVPEAAVALDLLGSENPRAQAVGLQVFSDLHARWKASIAHAS